MALAEELQTPTGGRMSAGTIDPRAAGEGVRVARLAFSPDSSTATVVEDEIRPWIEPEFVEHEPGPQLRTLNENQRIQTERREAVREDMDSVIRAVFYDMKAAQRSKRHRPGPKHNKKACGWCEFARLSGLYEARLAARYPELSHVKQSGNPD